MDDKGITRVFLLVKLFLKGRAYRLKKYSDVLLLHYNDYKLQGGKEKDGNRLQRPRQEAVYYQY